MASGSQATRVLQQPAVNFAVLGSGLHFYTITLQSSGLGEIACAEIPEMFLYMYTTTDITFV